MIAPHCRSDFAERVVFLQKKLEEQTSSFLEVIQDISETLKKEPSKENNLPWLSNSSSETQPERFSFEYLLPSARDVYPIPEGEEEDGDTVVHMPAPTPRQKACLAGLSGMSAMQPGTWLVVASVI